MSMQIGVFRFRQRIVRDTPFWTHVQFCDRSSRRPDARASHPSAHTHRRDAQSQCCVVPGADDPGSFPKRRTGDRDCPRLGDQPNAPLDLSDDRLGRLELGSGRHVTVGQRTSVAATTTLVHISVRSSQSRFNARAAGLLLGFVADRAFADPGRFHPVAGFGTAAIALQKMSYRDSRAAGTLHVAVLLAGTAGLGLAAEAASRRAGWVAVTGTTAIATWAVLGGTSLARTGIDMAARLEASQVDGDLTTARELLPSLCGRDPSVLGEEGLTRAALESVARTPRMQPSAQCSGVQLRACQVCSSTALPTHSTR